jgi:hypothetical protein
VPIGDTSRFWTVTSWYRPDARSMDVTLSGVKASAVYSVRSMEVFS